MNAPDPVERIQGPHGKPKISITEDLLMRIADLHLKGSSNKGIAKDLMVSYQFINQAFKREDLQAMVLRRIRAAITSEAASLQKALFKAVKEGNIQGIKLAYQIIGSLEPESQVKGGDTNLTVVLPGAAPVQREEKTFEVNQDGSEVNPD